MHKFLASAGEDAGTSALGRSVEEEPTANWLLRRWGSNINGVPTSAVMHNCWYMCLDDGFNETTAKLAINAIDHIASSDAPAIVIRVNSFGGSVYSLLPILDKLDAVRYNPETGKGKPIVTICSQKAMSCGAVLFLYGDVRHMVGAHSEIMIHPVSSWHAAGQENAVQSAARASQLARLNDQLFEAMRKHTGVDWEKLMKQKSVDGQEIHLTAHDLKNMEETMKDKKGNPIAAWKPVDPDTPMATSLVSYSPDFQRPCINFKVEPTPFLGDIGKDPHASEARGPAFEAPKLPDVEPPVAEAAGAPMRERFRARARAPAPAPAPAPALRMTAAAICAAFSNGMPHEAREF